jgi:hypothetical protein
MAGAIPEDPEDAALAAFPAERGIQPDSDRPLRGASWSNPRESPVAEFGAEPVPAPLAIREPPTDPALFGVAEMN